MTTLRVAAAIALAAWFTIAQAPKTPESYCTFPAEAEQQKVRKEFGTNFGILETKHFRLISDSTLRYRKLVAGNLEQFYGLVHPRFFKKEMRPVVVYLIDGADDYDAFCKKRGHADLGGGGYGVYVPAERTIYTRRLMPDGTVSGLGTLFHETIHAMVHADFGFNAPVWFDEGFASLFEQGRVVKGAWVYGNPNPWRDLPYREAFEAGKIGPLSKYLTLSDQEFRGGDELLHYNTGRSLCVWLLRQGEDKLAKYVDLVRQKKSGVSALESATGQKLPAIEKAWRQHVQDVHFAAALIQQSRKAPAGEKLGILAQGVQRHPDCGLLRLEYAQELAAAGKAEEAEQEALAALKDSRLPTPEMAWSILLFAYQRDPSKAAEVAQKLVEHQPWIDHIYDRAFSRWRSALDAQGKVEEAQRVEADLERFKRESAPVGGG
jgi:hypothetical protein